jgi:hypothetical protein
MLFTFIQWAAKIFQTAAEKYIFSNTNTSVHKQGIEVLLNFTFALVSRRKLSANCLQNFVFSVHLIFGYFSVANFLRKTVLPTATRSFAKLLLKKRLYCFKKM